MAEAGSAGAPWAPWVRAAAAGHAGKVLPWGSGSGKLEANQRRWSGPGWHLLLLLLLPETPHKCCTVPGPRRLPQCPEHCADITHLCSAPGSTSTHLSAPPCLLGLLSPGFRAYHPCTLPTPTNGSGALSPCRAPPCCPHPVLCIVFTCCLGW